MTNIWKLHAEHSGNGRKERQGAEDVVDALI